MYWHWQKKKEAVSGKEEKYNNAKKREGKSSGSAGGQLENFKNPNARRKTLEPSRVVARSTLFDVARRVAEFAGHNLRMLKKAVWICEHPHCFYIHFYFKLLSFY